MVGIVEEKWGTGVGDWVLGLGSQGRGFDEW